LIKTFAHWTRPVLRWPRSVKRAIVLAVDVALCVMAVWLAFYLRLGDFVSLQGPVLLAVGVSLGLALPIFVVSGLYRAIFRYSNLMAMATVVQAVAAYGVFYAFVFTGMVFEGVPRTVGLIQPVLLLLLVGASRAFAGFWFGRAYQSLVKRSALPQVLVYGAGSAGRQLAAAMAHGHEMQVVGYLDDDDRLHGQVLNGLRIYNPKNMAEVLGRLPVTDVLLALPTATRQRRNAILAELAHHHLAVRTLPSVTDLASGRVGLSDVRELDIDDLLGRDPVKPNGLLFNRNTHHKTVLVTGAGGSIGSELCRQILQCQPQKLLLLEMSEFALYQTHQDLEAQLARQASQTAQAGDAPGIQTELVPLLGSVCDELRMQEIMRTWRPHTVYHAAAYKHVPLVEHNPAEGVRNNVWGTLVCAQAAARNGVANFVLVSTDKAVRPTNIMGATKRLAEMVLQALALAQRQHTTFAMVRFGNVLGSSGSVVPLFREQIKNGGPITLTHPDITRYFMTIPEAAQLVIQAGAMATGGDVFVLDMGQPVRIADLAQRMVELSGLSVRKETNPEGDIALEVTGLRPGEKLYEELLIGDNPQPTQHKRIMKAHEDLLPWDALQPQLDALQACLFCNDVPGMRALLQTLVPGYTPADEVVDWVSLARANRPRLETL
jgi:FlaA1/EpsC-like NDP-sugar epimerase